MGTTPGRNSGVAAQMSDDWNATQGLPPAGPEVRAEPGLPDGFQLLVGPHVVEE